jgi:AraC-like DNA-binding protein
MKNIALGYTKYGIRMGLTYPESRLTLQTFPVRGRGETQVDRIVSALNPQRGMTVTPGMSFAVKLNANYEHYLLVLDTRALANKLTAMTGVAINRPLRFDPVRDDTRPAARALRNHFLFLVDQVGTATGPLPKMVRDEFEQMLMVMCLHANRHNYDHLLKQAPPDIAPRQVRQAEEYIEANWQRAITLETLAEVTGVSAFGLFRSFRKSRGYSPLEFLRQVRLCRAREFLQRPDAVTTIANIAATCGFAGIDSFSSIYRRTFGELPSETLSRGRGARSPAF